MGLVAHQHSSPPCSTTRLAVARRFVPARKGNPAVSVEKEKLTATAEEEHWFYACLTGRWLPNGLREMRLHRMKGAKSLQSVICWSGVQGTQDLIHPSKDTSGSLRICPENIYTITGLDDLGYDPEASDAIGRFAIKMSPQFRVNNRDGLWIHADWNFATSPGSAGCLVCSRADFAKVIFGQMVRAEFAAAHQPTPPLLS